MLLLDPQPGRKPQVSVVLLAHNHLSHTKQRFESLLAHTDGVDYELITVDNGSSDGTAEYFERLPHRKKLRFEETIGASRAINRGLQLGEGKYLLNLNDEIVLVSNWLKNLVSVLDSDDRAAMAVPVCDYSPSRQQVCTCLYRAEALAGAGWLDEQYAPGPCDSDTISVRLRRMGWRLVLAGETTARPLGSTPFDSASCCINILSY